MYIVIQVRNQSRSRNKINSRENYMVFSWDFTDQVWDFYVIFISVW